MNTETPSNPSNDDPRSTDQEDELQRLRAEVSQLRKRVPDTTAAPDAAPSQPTRRTEWWRALVTIVLVTLATLLAPVSVVATWSKDLVSDTDRYIETIAPLAENPVVQQAIATRITNEVMDRIDVRAVTDEAVDALTDRGLNARLAQSLTLLASPLSDGVYNFVHKQVLQIIESDNFLVAWDAANREAHVELVAVLTGRDTDTVEVTDNSVTVNLAALINTVKQNLLDNGFRLASQIPTVTAEFTLLQSDDLGDAQRAFRWLNATARVLPWLALGLLLAAVFLSRNRRRTLVIGSVAVAFSMVALGIALNIGRGEYLAALPGTINQEVAGLAFDQLVEFMRQALRAILALFLIVALIAWASGPGPAASGIRRGITGTINAIRHKRDGAGLNTGPVGEAVYTYRNPIRVAVLGLAFGGYVMADHPTARLTIWLAVIAGLILLVVEIIARPPVESAEPASA
ncbi:MAG: hypothetical protein HZY75_14245 [Nocardioidaceae bacterium]|nr:MAG: hypothetical protein HZY75_14245 [Nocardioidaceae bacterium]